MDATPRGGRAPVRRATQLMRDILDVSEDFEVHVARELTVNATDLQAMEHLIQRGPLSPTELAKRLDMSTAAVTTVVDRLTALGHVTRTQHPTDRRGVVIVPTPTSVAKAMSTLMPMIMGIDRVLDDFSPEEQSVITDYLERVVLAYRSQLPTD